jgi:hypothetical protein
MHGAGEEGEEHREEGGMEEDLEVSWETCSPPTGPLFGGGRDGRISL